MEKNKFIYGILWSIWYNSVKAGLVLNPEDYLYSSVRDYNGEKGLVDNIIVVI